MYYYILREGMKVSGKMSGFRLPCKFRRLHQYVISFSQNHPEATLNGYPTTLL